VIFHQNNITQWNSLAKVVFESGNSQANASAKVKRYGKKMRQTDILDARAAP
jgi:hypothetical protein